MITEEESIPSKNSKYRAAEDIFYVQFNDIFFYIEDEDQENFFFCILRKFFPDMKLEKIFPLNGKDNVVKESKKNIGDKSKIFIVDKDFDDILNKVHSAPNLFYLERYSIENHLLEKKAIIEYVVGEKPKLKREEIERSLAFDHLLSAICRPLKDLVCLHLVIQKNCLPIRNVAKNPERFLIFNQGIFTLKGDQIEGYKNEIICGLKEVDKRRTLNAQIKVVKTAVNFDERDICIKHMPGKYLVKLTKQVLESNFGLVSRNIESFCYHLALNCDFNSLTNLQLEIEDYIQ